MSSSVRRILKGGGGGGARNFRKLENKYLIQKLFRPKSVRFFCPKLGGEQKKGLHSNLVRFFAQNQVESKKNKVYTHIWSNFSPKRGCKTKRNAQNIALRGIKLYAQFAKGGGPRRNFAYYSVQLYDPGDPKRRAIAQ